jgi:hypothetical protein
MEFGFRVMNGHSAKTEADNFRLCHEFCAWPTDVAHRSFNLRMEALNLRTASVLRSLNLSRNRRRNRACMRIKSRSYTEGSLHIADPAAEVAAALYHQWLGASIIAKIVRTYEPFETALQCTRRMLGIGVPRADMPAPQAA